MTSSIRSSSQTLTVNPSQRAQLRAGVVGIGKQAIEDHIPGLLASDGAKLVAICDDDPEVVREQQYRQRVPGYTDFREGAARLKGLLTWSFAWFPVCR